MYIFVTEMHHKFPFDCVSICLVGSMSATQSVFQHTCMVCVGLPQARCPAMDIRGNLDPFGTYSDVQLWNSIERVGLGRVLARPGVLWRWVRRGVSFGTLSILQLPKTVRHRKKKQKAKKVHFWRTGLWTALPVQGQLMRG